MDKVIEDMARAICYETDPLKTDDWTLWEGEAQAALATLPPFIVLDEGAQVEVGDIVMHIPHNYNYGNEYFNVDKVREVGAHGLFLDSFAISECKVIGIIQRKGIPVLTRSKEDEVYTNNNDV